MNLVYDKTTLGVVSVFDNKFNIKSEEIFLKQTFPSNFANLSLWQIDKEINQNPMYLKIGLDEHGSPAILLYRSKEVYRISEKEKADRERKHQRVKDLTTIDGIFLKKDLSDFLISSPYTKKETATELLNGLIPYRRPVPVVVKGFFKVSTGYASICRNVLLRLHNYGVFAKPEYLLSHSDIDPMCLHYLSKYETLKFSRHRKDLVKILICTPMPGMFPDFKGRKIIFTMMETETLHPDFANGCNQYDEVWVPCRHNRDLFVNGGVKVPVHVIPLGVDERFYFGNNGRNINVADGLMPLLGSGLKKFKFISLFQWYNRKCPDILIKSFVKAFNGNDDVCLIVVSHHTPGEQVFNEVQNYAKSVRGSNYPSIFLYGNTPSDGQMPSVYKFCDAFISTSRGEGFSLPPIEAAACGLPVISSYHTAMRDYLTKDNSYIVSTTKREHTPADLVTMCGWYGGQLMNKLGDEEVDQFASHMKSVVGNYGVALNKAKKLQDVVRKNYTWDITTSLIARRIREG